MGKILFFNNIYRIYSAYLTDVSFTRSFTDWWKKREMTSLGEDMEHASVWRFTFTSAVSSSGSLVSL